MGGSGERNCLRIKKSRLKHRHKKRRGCREAESARKIGGNEKGKTSVMDFHGVCTVVAVLILFRLSRFLPLRPSLRRRRHLRRNRFTRTGNRSGGPNTHLASKKINLRSKLALNMNIFVCNLISVMALGGRECPTATSPAFW